MARTATFWRRGSEGPRGVPGAAQGTYPVGCCWCRPTHPALTLLTCLAIVVPPKLLRASCVEDKDLLDVAHNDLVGFALA